MVAAHYVEADVVFDELGHAVVVDLLPHLTQRDDSLWKDVVVVVVATDPSDDEESGEIVELRSRGANGDVCPLVILPFAA